MIISASRRCDIPAFYSEWFAGRVKEGYVYVKNPFNSHQISRVPLGTQLVDCIVFWTKNAAPLMEKLDMLDNMGYFYYFLWTINLYEADLEPNLPPKKQIIENFKLLSLRLGRQRVVLRYDPIIINKKYTFDYHIHQFDNLLSQLTGYTSRCIISFVDIYDKLSRYAKEAIGPEISNEIKFALAQRLSKIAKKYQITLQTCAEDIDLSSLGILHGACIDKDFIETLLGCCLQTGKARAQRRLCGCMESIDIGAYDCCMHLCAYCYANVSQSRVEKNIKKHDSSSPLLIGRAKQDDRIYDADVKSIINRQLSIFDIHL
jgi:hypothetical protein